MIDKFLGNLKGDLRKYNKGAGPLCNNYHQEQNNFSVKSEKRTIINNNDSSQEMHVRSD